jgi:hypothetical protein
MKTGKKRLLTCWRVQEVDAVLVVFENGLLFIAA